MKFSPALWASVAAFALLFNLGSCQLVKLLPEQHKTQLDRTSFIINFHESIGEPVSVAALTSTDAEPEAVRSAAEAQGRAAAAAAERILKLASDAGVTVERSETLGHVMTGMLLKVASDADGQKLSELLDADNSLGIKSLNNVLKFKVDISSQQPTDPGAVAANVAASAAAASDPAFAEPTIWGGADTATLVDLAQTDYSGQGERVAVVDDGLDFTHPAFGGCTAINSGGKCRVIAGKDYTDGDSITYDPCGSHGTHVAGIIAGDAMDIKSRTVPWRGVAYKASLGAYRVFGCDGTTQNDWLLQALEQAVKDKMSIINLSMGTSWTQPLGIEFTTRLAKQGVMVVAAAGNSGTDGLWTYGAPASEDDAVAIASTENKYSLGAAITLDKAIKVGGKTTRVVDATARALMQNMPPAAGTPLVLARPADACDTIKNKAEVAGKVAVVPLAICEEQDQAANLIAAGAAGVIFYNSAPAPAFKDTMNIDSLGEKGRQMYCTDLATGTALKAALAAGQSIKLTRVVSKRYLNPNADKISWFSSWGPNPELGLLPTFAAPGGGILSSIPGNNFAEYQGTSMATPYATGSLALWRSAHQGKLGSGHSVLDAAKAAFINTALPVKVDHSKWAHSVVMAGAGLVQVKSAIDNKVEVSPSYLSLPTGQQKNSVEVSFTNTGDKPVAYKLEHTPAVAIDTNNAWYGQESTQKLAAEVTFRNGADTQDIQTLTIAPGATEKIRAVVRIGNPLRASPMFYSGYLTLTPINPSGTAAAEAVANSAGARQLLQEGADVLAMANDNASAAAAAAKAGAVDFPAVSVPYLSLSQKYNDLALLAPRRTDDSAGQVLVNGMAYLCKLTDGTCAMAADTQIPTDTSSLKLGSVTFAMPLSRPAIAAWVEIYNANTNQYLGKTATLGPVAWAGPKGLLQFPDHVSGNYFTGSYEGANASRGTGMAAKLTAGTYRFVLVVRKPVATGDAGSVAASDNLDKIPVLGRLVVQTASSAEGSNGFQGK